MRSVPARLAPSRSSDCVLTKPLSPKKTSTPPEPRPWIQGASQYSRVHTRSGEYLLSRTLASLECELDPKRFFRIHRSAIVNAAHVREVRSSGDGRYNIYLHGGLALPMGRARREILEKLLSGIGSKDN